MFSVIGYMLLVCRCQMIGAPKDRRHWHCPRCGDLYATKNSIVMHIKESCRHVKGKRKRSLIINTPIELEAKRRRRAAEDWELEQMLATKALKFTVSL